jgi:fimbrial chaperone protein
MNISRLISSLVLLGLALGQTELSAGSFRISPIQLHLTRGDASALITIYNEGEQPVRFQVTASAWTQTETGTMSLAPTDDILFFPKLLEVAPKSERKVRVASSVKAVDTEKTYRIFFDELPETPAPGQGAKVAVVTKMGVPIFITPNGAAPAVRVSAAAAAGVATIEVGNEGTSFATLQEIRLRGIGADGAELLSERREGWYLLAGSIRKFEVPLGEKCSEIAELVIEAVWASPTNEDSRTVKEITRPVAGACGD